MAMTLRDGKVHYDCFICRRLFQFGEHVYDGRHIAEWDVQICRTCLSANWDGIVPQTHPDLVRHLEEKGIEIKLNAKGWLDIPSR